MLFGKYYLLKEAAQKLGVTSMTILRWERAGTIPKIRRHAKNGYRIFSEDDISKIRLLRRSY